MTALYITADTVASQTGGGAVTANELQALQELHGDIVLISKVELDKLYPGHDSSPFLSDYMAAEMAYDKMYQRKTIKHAHIYSGCFTHTVRFLQEEGIFVSYTCPAHDRHITIEEHQRLGLPYPYTHISDDRLWQIFFGGVRAADLVIAPSNLAADFIKSEGQSKVEIIPHGCVLPDRVLPFPSQFNAGYLGQVGPDKGIVYMLAAWAKLNYQDATLVLAGSQSTLLDAYIRKSVNGGKFHITGFVPNISDFFANISVYIQPSVCESFGIEILEAMAHGRPVIASDGAGASELITEGVDGFIVPKRDINAIADRIVWLRANWWKIPGMGEKAREKAEGYSWVKIREGYKQLWQSIGFPSNQE